MQSPTMLELETKSVRELMRLLLPTEPHFAAPYWFFRGQGDANWGLVPSIRRTKSWLPYGGAQSFGLVSDDDHVTSPEGDLIAAERMLLRALSTIIDRMGLPPNLKEEDALLAFARHIGVPTRLLDFSRSPWTAAYFAAADALQDDAGGRLAVFAVSDLFVKTQRWREEVEDHVVGAWGNPNLVAQQGLLIKVTGETLDLLEGIEVTRGRAESAPSEREASRLDRQLLKITLPARLAGDLLRMLRKQDVHAATVFPGQPGIAKLLSEMFLTEPPRQSPPSAGASQPKSRPKRAPSRNSKKRKKRRMEVG